MRMINRFFSRMLVASLTISTTGILGQIQASADEQSPILENTQSSQTTTESTEMSQVTSVSQLSDVQPSDWGFAALQSLVERYGCIKGYPNQTFRGDRSTTRYEFAAGLNTCLDQINALIAQGTADLVTAEDLNTIQRLQQEFETELAQLRGRLDNVESRIGTVEDNQFSTTSKLSGRILTYMGDVFGKDSGSTNNTKLDYQAIISLNSSFTGKDSLGISFLDTNFTEFKTAGNGETRFAGDIRDPRSGLRLVRLNYSFPVGKKLRVSISPSSSVRVLTKSVNALSQATVSDFASQNPLSYPIFPRAGVGVQWDASKWLNVDFAAGRERNINSPSEGLFGGGYLVSVRPVISLDKFRLTYSFIHSYSPAEGIDTWSGSKSAAILGVGPVVASTHLGSLNYQVSPTVELGASVGRSFARALGAGTQGDADVLTYRFNVAMRDLGKKGNLAGIIFGMQPKLIGTSNNAIALGVGLPAGQRSDRSTGFHIEGFYTHRLNNNISITPGIFWLTAPNHDNSNADEIVGVLRTAFTF
jgi:hypothetical protein